MNDEEQAQSEDDEPALSLSTPYGLADRIYDYLTDYIVDFYEETDGVPIERPEDGSDPEMVARIEHDLHDTQIMQDILDYLSENYDRRDNDDEINTQYDLITQALRESINRINPLDDRYVRGDTRFDIYDEEGERLKYPFFGVDEVVNEIFASTPYLKFSLEEIKAFLESVDNPQRRREYIRSAFNDDYTEIILSDGTRAGYKTYENGMLIWKGRYPNREGDRFLHWDDVVGHFDAMRKLGMLQSDTKPLPSMDGQLQLIADSEGGDTPPFSFSQEIIDEALTKGGSIVQSKLRIYEQFQKSLSRDENIRFLKNEYGIGGSSNAVDYTGIGESHDGKGIELSIGFGADSQRQLLKWNYVEKRIRELISMDRYLNEREKVVYPSWLEEQEQKRAQRAEDNRRREEERRLQMEMETAPEERQPENYEYQYHLGDSIYIGAVTYELLSIDDDRVMLFDPKFPLLNKEMSRSEFEQKVRENPLNNRLRVIVSALEQSDQKQAEASAPKTPVDRYFELKDLHPNSILLFRIGDFYEVMGDDAVMVSDVLELTLTSRRRNDTERVPLVGFPAYAVDSYKNMLLDMGWDIAIAEGNGEVQILVSDRKQQIGDSPDFDGAEIRRQLENSGIVNGQLVDPEKLDADPFIQQVMADAEAVQAEQPEEEVKLRSVVIDLRPDDVIVAEYIGRKVQIDYRDYLIEDVNERGEVSMRDLTFERDNGYPIFRNEKAGFVREMIALEQKRSADELIPSWEQTPRKQAQTFDLHPDVPMSQRHTFDLASNEVEAVGKKDRFRRNIAAIRTLKTCREENRFATLDEQIVLSKYVGWGGIPEAFDQDDQSWILEYNVLKNELTEEEYTSARASTLTAFYTPPAVINAVYKVMENMGFHRGNILEPSCGIGNFIGLYCLRQ